MCYVMKLRTRGGVRQAVRYGTGPTMMSYLAASKSVKMKVEMIIVRVSEYGICNLAPPQNMIFIMLSLDLGGEWSESNNFYAQT